MNRKLIYWYFIFLLSFSALLYFFIITWKKTHYSDQLLHTMITGQSIWRVKYQSPCDSAITGDPSVGDNWVKISFHCSGGVQTSTLALLALKDKTWQNIIWQYARIIGFSPDQVFDSDQWNCYLDQKTKIDQLDAGWSNQAQNRSTIDCLSPEKDLPYLVNYYGKNSN